ncbi:MAG: DUF4292 domain-containing protein [Myxococcales bacterium]|nr:DUF4292 domain-containing protein [Myxococcales bacterium]
MRFPRPLLAAPLAAALAGCPPRFDFGVHGEVRDPTVLLELVSKEEAKVSAVQGEAKIRVDSPKAKGVVSLFVAVEHASRLHLESLSFFGKPEAVLVLDGQSFGLYQAQEGRYYRGPASPQNVSRFLPVALPPSELVALMLGRAPRILPEVADLSLDEQARAYRVVLKAGPVRQTLWVDPSRLRVERSEVRGVPSYDLRFESFDRVAEAIYPRKVVMTVPSASATLELLYKDVSVNQVPDPTLFELSPPEGVPVVEVDELGNPRDGGEKAPPPEGPP